MPHHWIKLLLLHEDLNRQTNKLRKKFHTNFMHIVRPKKKWNMRKIAALAWGRSSIKIGYGTFSCHCDVIIMVIRIQHDYNTLYSWLLSTIISAFLNVNKEPMNVSLKKTHPFRLRSTRMEMTNKTNKFYLYSSIVVDFCSNDVFMFIFSVFFVLMQINKGGNKRPFNSSQNDICLSWKTTTVWFVK